MKVISYYVNSVKKWKILVSTVLVYLAEEDI